MSLSPATQRHLRRLYWSRLLLKANMLIGIAMPFLLGWAGLSVVDAMLLDAVLLGALLVGEVPSGLLADRIGRRQVLILTAALRGVGFLFYGAAPSFAMLTVGSALIGLSTSMGSGATEALVLDILRDGDGEAYSDGVFRRLHVAENLGRLVAAPLGALLIIEVATNVPVLLTALPCWLAGWLVARVPEPATTSERERPQIRSLLVGGLQMLQHNASFRRLTLNLALVSSAVIPMFKLSQLLLGRVGIPEPLFGGIYAGLILAQIVYLRFEGQLIDWIGGPARFLRWSAVATGLVLVLSAWIETVWAAVFLPMLVVAIGIGRQPVLYLAVTSQAPPARQATALSMASMFVAASTMLWVPLAGWLAEHALLLWAGASGLLAASSALCWPVREEDFPHARTASPEEAAPASDSAMVSPRAA